MCATVVPQIEPFSFNANGMNGGASVRLLCSAVAGDLPIDIAWMKDNVTITTGGDHRTQQLDDSTVILSLSRLSLSDSGNYTCQAVNQAGRASHSSLLQVKGTPNTIIVFLFLFFSDLRFKKWKMKFFCRFSWGVVGWWSSEKSCITVWSSYCIFFFLPLKGERTAGLLYFWFKLFPHSHSTSLLLVLMEIHFFVF